MPGISRRQPNVLTQEQRVQMRAREDFLKDHPDFELYSSNPRSCHHLLTDEVGNILPGTYSVFDMGPNHNGATVDVVCRGKKEEGLAWIPIARSFFVRKIDGIPALNQARYRIYDTTIIDEDSIVDQLKLKETTYSLTPPVTRSAQ
jgi:hypothetical protein